MFTPQELQEIQLFLGLLYPWTDPEKDLYKTVSWTFVGKDGSTQFANYAAQSMTEVIRLIENRTKRAGANVYMALSTQLLADTTVAELSATNTSLEDAFLALTSGSAEFRAAESS